MLEALIDRNERIEALIGREVQQLPALRNPPIPSAARGVLRTNRETTTRAVSALARPITPSSSTCIAVARSSNLMACFCETVG